MGLIMAISASAAMAGADGPIEPAPVYDEVLNQISLREAEMLFEEGVQFYDANELEIWAQGYIPGAIFFNVKDWKKLLPEDKSTTLVFYCVNPLYTTDIDGNFVSLGNAAGWNVCAIGDFSADGKDDQCLGHSQVTSNSGCSIDSEIPTEGDRSSTADDENNAERHGDQLDLFIGTALNLYFFSFFICF